MTLEDNRQDLARHQAEARRTLDRLKAQSALLRALLLGVLLLILLGAVWLS